MFANPETAEHANDQQEAAEVRAPQEDEARAQQEAEERAPQEDEARAQQEAEDLAWQEAEERAWQEAEARAELLKDELDAYDWGHANVYSTYRTSYP